MRSSQCPGQIKLLQRAFYHWAEPAHIAYMVTANCLLPCSLGMSKQAYTHQGSDSCLGKIPTVQNCARSLWEEATAHTVLVQEPHNRVSRVLGSPDTMDAQRCKSGIISPVLGGSQYWEHHQNQPAVWQASLCFLLPLKDAFVSYCYSLHKGKKKRPPWFSWRDSEIKTDYISQ